MYCKHPVLTDTSLGNAIKLNYYTITKGLNPNTEGRKHRHTAIH